MQDYPDEQDRLAQWGDGLKESGVKHCFFLTSDSGWKGVEDLMGDGLVWVPSIPLEHLDEQYKHSIMEDQVKTAPECDCSDVAEKFIKTSHCCII